MATASMTVGRPAPRISAHKILALLPRFTIALLLALLWAVPVLWMILTSLKPESQIVTLPPHILPNQLTDFTLDNYIKY